MVLISSIYTLIDVFMFFMCAQVGYFGLCYKTKKGYEWWVVLEKPIKKQLEQHAASSVGLCINLKFKIHFFVAGSSWLKLQDKLTRSFTFLSACILKYFLLTVVLWGINKL